MVCERIHFHLMVIVLSVGVSGCGIVTPDSVESPSTNHQCDLVQPEPEKAPLQLQTSGMYGGKVTSVGPDWVELGGGWEGWKVDQERQDTTRPKRISAAGTFPAGVRNGPGESWNTHWLADVRVGDRVGVFVGRLRDGREWMTAIHIERRPGGIIPQMPPDHLGWRPSPPGDYQAEQDWEEKGIPIPKEHLRSDGRAPWTNPPYPPVAPQPRPVKP